MVEWLRLDIFTIVFEGSNPSEVNRVYFTYNKILFYLRAKKFKFTARLVAIRVY